MDLQYRNTIYLKSFLKLDRKLLLLLDKEDFEKFHKLFKVRRKILSKINFFQLKLQKTEEIIEVLTSILVFEKKLQEKIKHLSIQTLEKLRELNIKSLEVSKFNPYISSKPIPKFFNQLE